MMFKKPCHGVITSLFQKSRLDPVGGKIIRPHWGTDYGSALDNTIMAAAKGVVRIAVNSSTGLGKYIIITHENGWETLYAHLSTISVSPLQNVSQGQKIGVKGTTGNSTGVHLHFELSKGKWSNQYTYHVNPAHYIDDPDVRALQTKLGQLGHKVVIDGLYGDGTTSAVSAFQKANKLVVDGAAGRATMASLEKSVASIVKPKPTQEPPKKEEKILEYEKNAKPSPSLVVEFNRAVQLGITDGTYPNRPATRAETAVMIVRAIEPYVLKKLPGI